ncbi:MAG: DUF4296 domain-containing protein [Paludibacteraceae bacterium]|nr:DUF4296 domain-containing protein [Paludibacteraceae bacterium]
MKRNLLILALLALLLGGCTIRPEGVLSKRKMQAVLYDLHKTEGLMQAVGYGYGRDYETSVYYQSTLAKHHVTQAQFDSSLVWYTDHPLLFNRVYPKVLDRIKAEQEMYEAESEELFDLKAKRRAAKKSNEWQQWIIEHSQPMEFSLWKDTFCTNFTPPLMENVTFFEKNDEKTCVNEKKAVPLQPISNNGDAMLLHKRD